MKKITRRKALELLVSGIGLGALTSCSKKEDLNYMLVATFDGLGGVEYEGFIKNPKLYSYKWIYLTNLVDPPAMLTAVDYNNDDHFEKIDILCAKGDPILGYLDSNELMKVYGYILKHGKRITIKENISPNYLRKINKNLTEI